MIRIPVFVYHHVSEALGDASRKTLISPERFKQQMSFLHQEGFRCLSLSEVLNNWHEGKPQPPRSFVLTFDDGYIDNYRNAAPILRSLGFSATIFVVVKPVEDGNRRYLSWQEMRELARDQFTFGSHTLTHPRLSSLDRSTIERELYESKKIIEDRLGLAVDLLAYPYGDSNERIQYLACMGGYHAACGVTEGHLTPFNLWRVPIDELESPLSFRWKARGTYYWYTRLLVENYLGRNMRALARHLKRSSS